MTGGKLYRLNADIYHKESGHYFVGYKNDFGNYSVCDNEGCLNISKNDSGKRGTELYRVDMYEDIAGRYFPKLENSGSKYVQMDDGRIELVEVTDKGSSGRIVGDHRKRLVGANASLISQSLGEMSLAGCYPPETTVQCGN